MRNVGILYDKKVSFNKKKPFTGFIYNRDYGLLLSLGRKYKLNIYLAPYTEYSRKFFKRAWQYKNGWRQVKHVKLNAVLDKMDGGLGFFLKKKIDRELPLINRPYLDLLCTDKWRLYKKWPKLMPKTVLGSQPISAKKIKSDLLIVKPRTGASGNGIYLVPRQTFKATNNNFIVQELILGGKILNISGPHDFRVIMGNDKPIFSTIRVPFRQKYISNVGQGGKEYYYQAEKIPKPILKIVKKIDKHFKKCNPRLYSIDFIVDKNGKPYIIELNSRPGLTHYKSRKLTLKLDKFICESFNKILANKCPT